MYDEAQERTRIEQRIRERLLLEGRGGGGGANHQDHNVIDPTNVISVVVDDDNSNNNNKKKSGLRGGRDSHLPLMCLFGFGLVAISIILGVFFTKRDGGGIDDGPTSSAPPIPTNIPVEPLSNMEYVLNFLIPALELDGMKVTNSSMVGTSQDEEESTTTSVLSSLTTHQEQALDWLVRCCHLSTTTTRHQKLINKS